MSTFSWLTLVMTSTTEFGEVPFFFVELEAQWDGIYNGIAIGIMLSAIFDLVQEGWKNGGGGWVVIGILYGGIFIYSIKIVGLDDL